MKLTKIQKEQLKDIKKTWGKEYGVQTIVVPEVVVITWARKFKGSKMIVVATSYYDQGEDDRFRVKTGEYFALMRMSNSNPEAMQLPLGELNDGIIEHILLDMFTL